MKEGYQWHLMGHTVQLVLINVFLKSSKEEYEQQT